jgi:hypothetical protein
MKKLLCLLPVLLLAVSMLHADGVQVATITSFSADLIVVKHNGAFSALTPAVPKPIYNGDEVWMRSASPGDWMTVTNSAVPNGFTIHSSDVYPAYLSGRSWSAAGHWDNPGKGDGSFIVIPQPDPPIYGAVGMCPPGNRD